MYKIKCGYCGEEITSTGENDEEGMEKMKEEATLHNETFHPDEAVVSEEELEKDIRGKWTKEEG